MNGTDVQSTLREMWETRPARPRHDRKIAGVAAAIARRYDIDPVLVRVGFVVAAFYGIGAALYIAGWVLLPEADENDPTDGADSAAAPGKRPHPGLLIALIIAAVVGTGAVFGRDGGIILPAIAALGLLFLLHRSRGSRGPAAGAAPGSADPATGADAEATAAPAAPVSMTKPGTAGTGDTAAADPTVELDPVTGEPRPTPPSWDPLGAAPFAWDLPEPAPDPVPEPPSPRRKPPVTAVTYALALVTGGVLGALLLLGHGITSLPVVLGIVLAILGTGLVVGAFTRTGRGLVPAALLMCLLTWAAVQVPLDGLRGGVGNTEVRPTSIEVLAPSYDRAAGNVGIDLRDLDLRVPPGADAAALTPASTSVSVGMGNVEVWVPADADVTLHGSAGLGHVQFGDRESSGNSPVVDAVDDLGSDGVRSGRAIDLDLHAGLGNVEVHRG